MKNLKVGDTVVWRGCFGSEEAKNAVVKGIELCEKRRSKYGVKVTEVPWDKKDYIIVSLDNGHWAYGDQISEK